MFYLRLVGFHIFFLFLVGCGGNSAPQAELVKPPEILPEIQSFYFLASNNLELLDDVELTLDETNKLFSGTIDENIQVTDLIADFAFNGSRIEIDNVAQISGQTSNDFTDRVIYKVYNANNDSISYTVDLVKFTGLPVLNINTENSTAIDSKKDYISADLQVDGWRHFNDVSFPNSQIRGRGHSTWEWYPKKPYQIKLAEDDSILGMPQARRWVFLAEYADKTMIRNKIAFEFGKLSNLSWTPSSEFIEVFINEEYSGTYNLTEKVELHASKISANASMVLLEIDQLDRLDEQSTYFHSNFFLFSIKDPEISQNDEEFMHIKNIILEFEEALLNRRFSDDADGYRSLIKLESFVDWFLINEITKNIDAGAFYSSVFIVIDINGMIELGPIWDFDLSMASDYEGWWMINSPWFEMLLQDPIFVDLVQDRFSYFYSQKTQIMRKIDEYAQYLHLAIKQNDSRWGTIGTYVFPNPTYFETYEEEVFFLKTWLDNRMNWLADEISDL